MIVTYKYEASLWVLRDLTQADMYSESFALTNTQMNPNSANKSINWLSKLQTPAC